ncbi:MAG: hypothetical protein H0T42_21015 [Deltaproteobacteria bacterium]|nr:hypothetical protein [Deltaproteobacteria bacterium]
MSNLKTIIATLILGSSSVALADTNFSFKASAHTSWGTPTTVPTVRDHRFSTTAYRPMVRGTWISLAEPMSGNAHLRLQSQAQLNQIRIQSASGASYISHVSVRFMDGTRQSITLNKWVDGRNPMLQFSLDRSARVDRILIQGSAHGRRGSYQVFGYGTRMAEAPMPPVYQPPVYQPPVFQPPIYQPTVTLAAGLNFFGTTGRKFVAVDQNLGRFSTIRVQGLSGHTRIQRIEVRFANGYEQTLDAVNRTLLPGQVLDIPLDAAGGSLMRQISVFTNDGYTPVQTLTGEVSVSAF